MKRKPRPRNDSPFAFREYGRKVDPIMQATRMLIIPVIGEVTEDMPDLAARPGLDALRRVIEPHLDGQRLERVRVLYEGEYRDMFVGETSAIDGIRNVRATGIYHANMIAAIARGDAKDPGNWPPICGPAVLFPHRPVWF